MNQFPELRLTFHLNQPHSVYQTVNLEDHQGKLIPASAEQGKTDNRQLIFGFPQPCSGTTNGLWPILVVSYPEIQADKTENDFFPSPGRDSSGSLEPRFFLWAIIEAQMFWFDFVCLFFA